MVGSVCFAVFHGACKRRKQNMFFFESAIVIFSVSSMRRIFMLSVADLFCPYKTSAMLASAIHFKQRSPNVSRVAGERDARLTVQENVTKDATT